MKTDSEKAVGRFLSSLKRRAKRPTTGREYLCEGGPYDGKHIFLTRDQTLTFRVNKAKGYYVCSTCRGKTIQWFPMQ